MNFTVMIPSRKRQHMLAVLLPSVFKTAMFKDKVEVLVTYDNDDRSTIDALPRLQELVKDYNVQFISRDRHYSINDSYYNMMASRATGKYLIAVNDDTVFLQTSWDALALIKIEDYLQTHKDGIFYGITNDKEVESKRNESNWFSCFPLISKKTVEVLGFFFDPAFPKDGADWDIVETFREIGRILDLRNEIVIEHISFRSGRRTKDLLDEDIIEIPNEHTASAGLNKTKNVNTLREYIDNYGKS